MMLQIPQFLRFAGILGNCTTGNSLMSCIDLPKGLEKHGSFFPKTAPHPRAGPVRYRSPAPLTLMELSCNTGHNQRTSVALLPEDSSRVFVNPLIMESRCKEMAILILAYLVWLQLRRGSCSWWS